VEAVIDGRLVNLGPPKQRALFALLMSRIDRPVAVDVLIEELWAGNPPPAAMASLQTYVSNLRRVLEPHRAPRTPATVLRTRAPGYQLDSSTADVDVHRFTDHATAGRQALDRADPQRALDELDAALALWRGDAYADARDAPWAAPEITRLEELRLTVIEARSTALIELGAHHTAVPDLEVHVRAHPLREHGCQLLALALYRAGRQADALALIRATRSKLAQELGIDPGPALQQLECDILTQTPTLAWRPLGDRDTSWEAGTATGAWRSTYSRPSTPSPQPTRPSTDPGQPAGPAHGVSRSPLPPMPGRARDDCDLVTTIAKRQETELSPTTASKLVAEFNLGIIGGGAAAVSLLDALSRRTSHRLNVTLFESAKHVGPGRAYQSDSEVALLNRQAGLMSLRHGNPGHFLHWINHQLLSDYQRFQPADKNAFLPRRLFGKYLESNITRIFDGLAEQGSLVRVVEDTAVDVRESRRSVTVRTMDGSVLTDLDQVVLCTGTGGPVDVYHLSGSPGYVHDPLSGSTAVPVGAGS
jgi:DNA-binding SARP family transcriptional activator